MTYTMAEIRKTLKPIDAWWAVLVVDPLAIRITWLLANFTRISPNTVTVISLAINIAAALAFLKNNLYLGAILFFLAFTLDAVDGKLARVTDRSSKFGQFLDIAADISGQFLVTFGLIMGSYLISNDTTVLIAGFIFIWAKMFLALLFELKQTLLPDTNSHSIISSRSSQLSDKLKSHRLSGLPGTIDIDALVYVICPILGLAKFGLIVGSSICMLLILGKCVAILITLRKH